MNRALRTRLVEWYTKSAQTIVAMSPEQIERLNAWRDLHPDQSDADWPEVLALVGPRPKHEPLLIVRRSA